MACTVLPVSDQRVQRVGLLVNDDKLDLLADLHTEEDLGEGCVPVDRLAATKDTPGSLKKFLLSKKNIHNSSPPS